MEAAYKNGLRGPTDTTDTNDTRYPHVAMLLFVTLCFGDEMRQVFCSYIDSSLPRSRNALAMGGVDGQSNNYTKNRLPKNGGKGTHSDVIPHVRKRMCIYTWTSV